MRVIFSKSSLLLIVLGIVSLFVIVSFRQNEVSPNAVITKRYSQQFDELKKAAAQFQQLVTANATTNNKQAILTSYYNLRSYFKQVEFLWEYLDPIYVKEWINGAPLPKLDKSAPQLIITEPKGLQVLDELLFADTVDAKAITKIATELNQAIQQYPVQQKLTDRVIFDAMRIEWIRLFNLGFTGFELPGSDRALADATVVITQLELTVTDYKNAISQKDNVLFDAMQNDFAKAKKLLQQAKNFETFDRLTFLISVVNPLYKNILKAQQLLGVESIYEVVPSSSRIALNYNAQNLFANDFLNPFYYINVPQKLHSPKLVELGKFLFYDPILSASNDRSCASCHNPQKGFTDGIAKSMATGMNGTVQRNSPTLINAVFSERFFHDLRADALEDQMEHVVASEKEFNTTMFEIYGKLGKSATYISYFKEVFPEYPNPINQQTIAFAMSSYVSSLVSYNSPFDKYVRGESATLPTSAKRGFNLFMGKAACGTCHFAPNFNGTVPPLFNDSESEVLGVLENPYAKIGKLDSDLGRYDARLKESADFYKHSFKTPTIRNIALTAPYMHNGAYKTLEDVMDFYNKGGGAGLGLDVPYQTLSPEPLNLSKQETADIIAFMKALTDTTNLTSVPTQLPKFETQANWNTRKVGGNY